MGEAVACADLVLIMTDHLSFINDPTANGLLKAASDSGVMIDGRNILVTAGTETAAWSFKRRQMEGFQVLSNR